MIELPLVFVAGFLGSSHCVGMCGPFALLLGTSASSWYVGLGRQLLYSLGRVFTYATIGAFAGYGGWEIAASAPRLLNVPALLAIGAGALLVYQGLATSGVIGKGILAGSVAGCLGGGLLGGLLRSPRLRDLFLAGVLTGFLPCGLVYGFVGIAASTRNVLGGMMTMVAFGLGTVPVMVAVAGGGKVLSFAARRRLLKVAACCVVLAGVLSIARGLNYWGVDISLAAGYCPLCP